MLIECNNCRAVFSLQDGVAPAGSRFKVQCGRCESVFEAVVASAPAAAPAAPPEPPPPDEKKEWSPEPAEAVVEPEGALEPGIAQPAPETPPADDAPAAQGSTASRRRRVAGAFAFAVAVVAAVVLYQRGRGSTVEDKMRRGHEILLRDDTRSLQEAAKLFTDAARASAGQAVPEAERAFALLLQAKAHKDLAARLAAAEREEQEKAAAKLLQQGAAAARQAIGEDQEAPAALRATALAEAITGKADEAQTHADQADRAAPGDPWTLYVKGASAAAGHKQDRAVQALAAARQIEPRLIRVDVDLAGMSLDSGDTAGARVLLERVLKENPRHERAQRMLAAITP
ncbi:MAG TPA: zinc-ribbon domain-containing protein [Myxococcales bacterium]|nr:zinc-ribbon domain-containing protein [Myxococcales bacterium]